MESREAVRNFSEERSERRRNCRQGSSCSGGSCTAMHLKMKKQNLRSRGGGRCRSIDRRRGNRVRRSGDRGRSSNSGRGCSSRSNGISRSSDRGRSSNNGRGCSSRGRNRSSRSIDRCLYYNGSRDYSSRGRRESGLSGRLGSGDWGRGGSSLGGNFGGYRFATFVTIPLTITALIPVA